MTVNCIFPPIFEDRSTTLTPYTLTTLTPHVLNTLAAHILATLTAHTRTTLTACMLYPLVLSFRGRRRIQCTRRHYRSDFLQKGKDRR
jgi:hypothetical protein